MRAQVRGRPGKSADPQRALLEAALQLFARDGIGAVSQRAIVKASGVSNQYAVHYYFGGKDGLVKAVLDDVAAPLCAAQLASLASLEDEARPPEIRRILQAIFDPQIEMARSSQRGMDAARLLSRLISELGPAGHKLLFGAFGEVFSRTTALLARAVPGKPVPVLRLHFLLAINNVFHGIVDMPLLNETPHETIRYASTPSAKLRENTLYNHFFDYIVAGVSASS